MSTPSGIARAHFLAIGVKFVYGSDDEYIAMQDFSRERELNLMTPIMASATPDTFSNIVSKFKGTVFPEFKIDEIQKLNKFKEQYELYKDLDLTIQT